MTQRVRLHWRAVLGPNALKLVTWLKGIEITIHNDDLTATLIDRGLVEPVDADTGRKDAA